MSSAGLQTEGIKPGIASRCCQLLFIEKNTLLQTRRILQIADPRVQAIPSEGGIGIIPIQQRKSNCTWLRKGVRNQ
jgi:hypothetical protein